MHSRNDMPSPFTFGGTGEIYSYTIIRHPPKGYESHTPYALALIKLDEGPMITAQLTDIPDPHIGERVEMVTRKLSEEGPEGIILYGYKFRRLLPRGNATESG